jgi:hypothetical protein
MCINIIGGYVYFVRTPQLHTAVVLTSQLQLPTTTSKSSLFASDLHFLQNEESTQEDRAQRGT